MSNQFKRINMRTQKLLAVMLVLLLAMQCAMTGTLKADAAGNWYVTVTGSSVNVRADAGPSRQVLGTVPCGSQYGYLTEKKGDDGKVWYNIQYTASQTGWITSQYSAKLQSSAPQQDMINRLAASYGTVGMQVALIQNGKVTETYNYGYAVKSSRKMASDDKIRIASLSKVFTAMNIMKLSEQGTVNINSNIGGYWGASLPKAVTLKSLLTHTSTLSELDYSDTKSGTLSQLKKSGNYKSGTVGSPSMWLYNNYGVGIAGSTAEVALNKPLDNFAHTAFLDGLSIDASYRSGSVKKQQYAIPYYSSGEAALSLSTLKSIKVNSTPGNNTASFAGGLTISAKDYAKLLAILVNDGTYDGKTYLSAQSVATIEKPLFSTSEHGGTFYQCMPMRYKEGLYGQSRLYYHTGNAYGVLALASYNPDTRNGVVVLSTGASQARDTQGVYGVCSVISRNLYNYMDNTFKPAQAVVISADSLKLKKGSEQTLTAMLEPADSTDEIVWTTGDERIATVSKEGKVTVKGHGTTYITATAGNASAICKIESAPELSFRMLGGSIRVSEPYGIRFGINVDKDTEYKNTKIIEYGTLMLPTKKLAQGEELTLSTPNVLRVPAAYKYSEDSKQFTYTGVLVNIPDSFLRTDVAGRGYMIYEEADGTQQFVYTDCAVRNFMGLAQAAYDRYSAIQSPTAAEQAILEKLAAILGIAENEEPEEEYGDNLVEVSPSDAQEDTTTTTTTTTTEPTQPTAANNSSANSQQTTSGSDA